MKKEGYEFNEDEYQMVCESNGLTGWGGSWTEQKLDTFEKYVKAYLTIMNTHRDRFGWKLIYFDGFAGSGTRDETEQEKELCSMGDIFGSDLIDITEIEVYKGAAERVVGLEEQLRGFDYYYFIDKREENCQKLEEKLSLYRTEGKKLFRSGDANFWANKLSEFINNNRNIRCLCLLDPFGMSIKWDTIEKLALKGVDLWILLPSGVIINRLLKKDGSLMYPDKLERFFGIDKKFIHNYFYEEQISQPDLFGDTYEWYHKKDNSITRIANLYCERLSQFFPFVTNQPLVMRNYHNVPIFHFVFASHNETAVKIAQQIINKRQNL